MKIFILLIFVLLSSCYSNTFPKQDETLHNTMVYLLEKQNEEYCITIYQHCVGTVKQYCWKNVYNLPLPTWEPKQIDCANFLNPMGFPYTCQDTSSGPVCIAP